MTYRKGNQKILTLYIIYSTKYIISYTGEYILLNGEEINIIKT